MCALSSVSVGIVLADRELGVLSKIILSACAADFPEVERTVCFARCARCFVADWDKRRSFELSYRGGDNMSRI